MSVIIKPVLTEKMTAISEKMSRYGFVVQRSANKIEIKKAIENFYGVQVIDVTTMIVNGKPKSRYTRSGIQKGRTSSYKKAIVTLAKGDNIDFYSNI